MRIVTLVENLVYGKFTAEHGLSLYIEHEGNRILFDTGQSDRFLRNAELLGIDISRVDTLVLSHGHYDHAGGLEHFCRANSGARIFAKRGVFNKKFNRDGRFIGIPYNSSLFGGRLTELDARTEIAPGVHIVTDIPLANSWDTHFENLLVRADPSDEALGADTFEDEQFLAIELPGGLAVISGCSHRGITNILESAQRAFFSAKELGRHARDGDGPVAAPTAGATSKGAAAADVASTGATFKGAASTAFSLVLGGFHLSNASEDLAERVTQRLADAPIARLGCCHCTGVDNYARIKNRFGARAFYAWTGTDCTI